MKELAVKAEHKVEGWSETTTDTSRLKTLYLRPPEQYWVLERDANIITFHLTNFKAFITEETLSIGNITTHIKLTFDVASRVNYRDFWVNFQLYKTDGNKLYSILMPPLPVHCRPQDRYGYDSGLVKLENNHFDIISTYADSRISAPSRRHRLLRINSRKHFCSR